MEDNDFIDHLVFSDKTIFHLNVKVKHHCVRIWETEQPHAVVTHKCDSCKLNVFGAISKTKVYRPCCSVNKTVMGVFQIDMMQLW